MSTTITLAISEFYHFINNWNPIDTWKLLFYGYVLTFSGLLLTATIGRRLGIRRKYIHALDRLFQFAAAKLDHHDEEAVEDELTSDDEGVVICPESPKATLDKNDPIGEYKLHQTMPYVSAAMGAIVSDCVSRSFTSEELHTWNMLSRTRRKEYLRMSKSLTVFWLVGCFIRYVFIFPARIIILSISLSTLVLSTTMVGFLPSSKFKKKLNRWVVIACFEFVAGSLSVTARFHDKINRPRYGIAVSNHTSPIDFMVLATDNCYDTVGQKTKGFLGVFLSALSKSSAHIWFDRATTKDRTAVASRMQSHAQDKTLPPLLVFPEGCCVNNTAVIQFKKGAFEVDSDIYPIAVRFDPRYGDPFWWQDSFFKYCLAMMSSWAIVCDVWYLPPMRKQPHETAITFANRVRSVIAHKAGFVELAWDGFIKVHNKNSEVWKKKESDWKRKQQNEFARHLSLSDDEEIETTNHIDSKDAHNDENHLKSKNNDNCDFKNQNKHHKDEEIKLFKSLEQFESASKIDDLNDKNYSQPSEDSSKISCESEVRRELLLNLSNTPQLSSEC